MYERFDVVCISICCVCISVRLVGLNIYFYDVQKEVYRNEVFLLLWDRIKVHQTNLLYTTITNIGNLKIFGIRTDLISRITPSAKLTSFRLLIYRSFSNSRIPRPTKISGSPGLFGNLNLIQINYLQVYNFVKKLRSCIKMAIFRSFKLHLYANIIWME